jgi:hypothetical protein
MRELKQPEERLSAALRELAASSGQGPSPELGVMLKDAFRHHHVRRRRRLLRTHLALLTICLAALTGSLLLWKTPTQNPSAPVATIQTIPPEQVVYPREVTVSKAERSAPRRRSSSDSPKPKRNEFVALPSFDMLPASDELRVVRLELPGEDLRLVGAPVTEELARRRVTADFVVGHDGTAYAVRYVQAKF